MEHAQWHQVRTRILGRGNGHCMLPNKYSTFIKNGDKTPHEVWIGKNHYLKHLMVIIYYSYVRTLRENSSKLDKKS